MDRVKSYEVVPDLHDVLPEMPDAGKPHIVHRLGPDLHIPTISTTGTYPAARLGTARPLLTHPTLKEASSASRELRQFG